MKAFPNKLKCVIWDLDDTLWQGTLAEGDQVVPRSELIELIAQLDQRGVINSICSKNDPAEARRILERLGIWSYMVFPSIGFAPKGESVKTLIGNLQLQPANVLFIDDNHANRHEVSYYNPQIMVADPEQEGFLADLRELVAVCEGSSRLEHYRVIERKSQARRSFPSNAAFLRDSGITLCILRNPADLTFKERIVELVNRANQLNFTKSRFPTPADFDDYTERATIVHGCVFAYDRYGDYGLVGFFAFDESTRKRSLQHFVFSCRIMNMGLEQAVYGDLCRQFGLEPFAAVARQPSDASAIRIIHQLDDHLQTYVRSDMEIPERFRTSIIAGCTSGVIAHYLPPVFSPARHDLFHLAGWEHPIAGVDTILYAVYGDYGSDAWKTERFSYGKFRHCLERFLQAHSQHHVVLLLASERAFPHGHRNGVYERARGWLSDLYRGKTRRRMLKCNQIVKDAARARPGVSLVDPGGFVSKADEQIDPRHFARIVIQRICEALPDLVSIGSAGPPPLSQAPGRRCPSRHSPSVRSATQTPVAQ